MVLSRSDLPGEMAIKMGTGGITSSLQLQGFDAVGWVTGRASSLWNISH